MTEKCNKEECRGSLPSFIYFWKCVPNFSQMIFLLYESVVNCSIPPKKMLQWQNHECVQRNPNKMDAVDGPFCRIFIYTKRPPQASCQGDFFFSIDRKTEISIWLHMMDETANIYSCLETYCMQTDTRGVTRQAG